MLRKLEKLVFYTLIFSIPFQTRIVLRSWGIGFNEWNAAFLYWTDLLILAILGLWALRIILKKGEFKFSNYDWFLVGFLAVSAISIKNASNQALGFYQLLKFVEFSFLYFYVKSNLGTVFNMTTSFFVLLASGFFQAVLATLQYFRQADLGLRFLGETVLDPDLFNVAVFLASGEKIMRPYGTTPHPNVLALIIFISIFILYFLKFGPKFKNIIYGVLLFAFFLTFSRIIIFAWVISLLFSIKKLDKKIIIVTLVVMVLFSILFWPQVLARLQISPQEEAVSLRGFYNKISLFEKPFFGVGLGNFVNWFKEINLGLTPNLYQPVHNIYLLIFSETGILGIALFLLFLFFLIRNFLKETPFNRPFHYSLLILFVSILFLGLFDHFLWTLQQGRIILFLTAGLLAAIFAKPMTFAKQKDKGVGARSLPCSGRIETKGFQGANFAAKRS